MPYKDKEKQKACWKRYAQSPKAKIVKERWYAKNKEIMVQRQRERYKAEPEKYRTYFRTYLLFKKYGITQTDYDRMFAEQNGACAICGKGPDIERYGIIRFAIDHDHKTGKVRGLLCNNCNVGIGLLGDTMDHLEFAIRYFKKHHEQEA